MVCRSNSRSSPEFVKKIEELRLNLAVMAGAAAKFATEIERSKRLVEAIIEDTRRRRQRLQMDLEPARKTDNLLNAIGVDPTGRIPDADASGPSGPVPGLDPATARDRMPLTSSPTNDATTDALEGGGA
jgi:hypothetical protein